MATGGVKTTLKVNACPGASVRGRVIPVVLKPLPLDVTAEMVTVAVPVLVSVTLCDALLPTVTFPKDRLVGLTLSLRFRPRPLRETNVGEFVAALATDTLPDTVFSSAGENWAEKVPVCPGARLRGKATPLMLKPVPLTLAWVTTRFELPVLVRLTVCVLLLPTITSPKATLPGLALSGGGDAWGAALCPPAPAHALVHNVIATAKAKPKPRPFRTPFPRMLIARPLAFPVIQVSTGYELRGFT